MTSPSESSCPQANCLIEAGLREQILLPSDPGYRVREATYWSRSASLSPACVVRPRFATKVPAALKALINAGQSFAVRSGGHAPSTGVSSIKDGVTIDLSLINHIVYDAHSQTVRLGPSQKWKELYKLQKFDRTVAGSRDGNVGVAGFLLGGGYSWITTRTGWGCDNVVSYEVVLADGRITTVSAKEDQHPDLFLALKGGGNNFGIITSFTMNTVHCNRVWGGKAIAPKATIPNVIRIASGFSETVTKYPDSNMVIVITYVPEQDDILASAAIVQTQGIADDPGLSEFMDLPMMLNTTKLTTIYDTTFEFLLPPGYHNVWFTASFKNDERIIAKAVDAHENLVETLKLHVPEQDFRTQCIFQPIPKLISGLSAATGGNIMGLERHKSHGVLFLLSAMMKTSAQKDFAHSKVREAVEEVKEYAAVTVDEGNLPWIYMNYADKSQNVLGSYGEDNVKIMKEVAAKYDPQQVFQKLCPGGWKISDVSDLTSGIRH
ncbi:FAD-binding domain-containing protein [Hypoxylon trugodes]|uniref:FAD-binding domain-containing protein n=1 Tax=Hypoxylon trugodes TaxID=326681 RepID=UPI00219720DF|nr:FAD-binding domain-containing protein [Hypoxylon trugodes]KAI1389101.1 FAD-binding domain-containing protein [Hypoxylon trugodes]